MATVMNYLVYLPKNVNFLNSKTTYSIILIYKER